MKAGKLYWWLNRFGIQKRGRRDKWRKKEPDPHVKAALEAYQAGVEVRKVGIPETILYYWIDRLEIPKHGRINTTRKTTPDKRVRDALRIYEEGAKVREVGISQSTLYTWLTRLNIPRRQFNRPKTGKRGHPLEKPWVYECEWCGDSLSAGQVKKRRKYCSHECAREGIEDERKRSLSYCVGCGVEIKHDPEMPYCTWKCFRSTMEAKFG